MIQTSSGGGAASGVPTGSEAVAIASGSEPARTGCSSGAPCQAGSRVTTTDAAVRARRHGPGIESQVVRPTTTGRPATVSRK
ncbi:MAG: hypothetical protein BGO96_13500 [Micrococcales bacterium 73-15]|nr:MAG: hypothetical protein BGO96_13500 [Micrococcales bacterium 73-15]